MLKIGTHFSGIGGFEQALKNLGIPHEIKWACDIDKRCKQTYLANFNPQRWDDDVSTLDPNELDSVDLYCFSFPCTDISAEGELDLTNGESSLIFYALNAADTVLPKYLIFENVKGLTWPRFKDFYESIKERIEANYNFHLYHLNSKEFGVPQGRPRVYGIGIRKDLGRKPDNFQFSKSKSHLNQILEPKVDEKYFIAPERVEKILKACEEKQKYFKLDLNKLAEVKHTRSNGFQPAKKIRYEGISFCLTSSVVHGIMENGRIRAFTPRECARLQGFPDDFVIPVADSYAYQQFGNSVTVPVVEQILKNLLQ